MEETYVCTDVETDGPSPGHYSMLSIASVAFQLDKSILGTFERNLELLPNARQAERTMRFWQDNPAAWAACRSNLISPAAAMRDYSQWLLSLPGKPVMVSHPISFDFTFVHWYLHEFTGDNPFWPAGLDIASYAMAVLGGRFTESHRSYMPTEWIDPKLPHTHRAIDDALGHAMCFCNMAAANKSRQANSPPKPNAR
jgi:DNA polymerase III alpha subunit (gram-positive type)